MPMMPVITSKVMTSFLLSKGFALMRQKGSHKFFRHPDGRTATVPEHKGEDLGRGITKKILNDAELNQEDFLKWQNKKK
ncbi:MAG: type II toxin-antitoxin system HicA family toxin [Nitrospinae bacterium]|nr:type II toxin-antitoxin system HicA family toxin [Nitrospinota bacterium]